MKQQLAAQLAEYALSVPSFSSMHRPTTNHHPDYKPALAQALKAWEEYLQTVDGKAMVASLPNQTLNEVRASLGVITEHSIFRKLIKWIREQDYLAASFSIGLKVEAELVLGGTAIIGLAVGIGTANGKESAEFLTLGLDEGIEVGVMAGVVFGMWAVSPGDLGGFSLCTEVDLGLEAEVSEATYYTTHDFLGETICIGIGAEDGVSEMECYTFILGDQGDTGREPYLKPVVQVPKSHLLIIESVTCKHPSNDGAGNENEVYFIFQADDGKAYPFPTYDYYSMKEGDVWQTGRSVWFDSYVTINIYDEDNTSENDLVGTFRIDLSQLTLGNLQTFNSTKDFSSFTDKVEYTVQVKLVATNVSFT